MVLRFCNETQKTTLLPPLDLRSANSVKADAAEKVAVAAGTRRSAAVRTAPSTLVEVEELLGQLVRVGSADGYHALAPGSGLFYKCGSSARHRSMLSSSYPMPSSAATTQGLSAPAAGAALPTTHSTGHVTAAAAGQSLLHMLCRTTCTARATFNRHWMFMCMWCRHVVTVQRWLSLHL